MAKQHEADVEDEPTHPRKKSTPPARSLEARENQLIAKAMDEIERRIDNGTATSQILVEFAKRGSTQAQLEKANKEIEAELNRAKIDQLKSQKSMEELYGRAIEAMQIYRGPQDDEN